MKTALTEALGISKPIIQGGMHHVGLAPLCAAVSEAGGLGAITALTLPTPELLREEIRKVKKMTDKPFMVNITLLPVSATPPDYEAYSRVIIEEGVKVVETAGRNPEKFIKLFKEQGIKVIHKCTQIRHAVAAEKMGCDFISLDGSDCGGHPGEVHVGNWSLAPRGIEELGIPYVVSGGVSNGHQLAAALAMGACGVNMGSRFMATKEAPIHDNIKKALVGAKETDTNLIFTTLNNTERVFKNETSDKVVEIEKEHPGDFSKVRPYVLGENYRKSFQETGNTQDSCWSCGQGIGLIHDIPSCNELLERMTRECQESVNRLRASL